MKKLLLAAAAAALLAGSASAADFSMSSTPIQMDLSATDVNSDSYTVNFSAGIYSISLVKGVYTAFAPATPSAGNWTDYYQYTVGSGSMQYWNPLSGGTYNFSDATTAFNAFSAQPQLTLSFSQATSVLFHVGDSDYSLGDNTGGTSLRVAAVPEPASWLMMIVGFGAVGAMIRRRRHAGAQFAF